MKLITHTNRSTANYYHLTPKKKIYRTTLEVSIQLYNQPPAELKHIKPLSFKKKLNKFDIDFKPAA